MTNSYEFKISEKLKNLLEQFKDQSLVASLLLKGKIEKEICAEQPVDYISISDDDGGKISYLTKDRVNVIPEDQIWTSKKRFHCKPGAFVNKIFQNIGFIEVERFSNLFRSHSLRRDFKFEVVSGSEIIKWYNGDYYETEYGSLGASCMRYNSCSSYFDIYTENDCVSMLIMKSSSGRLLGRSLLWNISKEIKVMDRIYTICDEELQHFFKKWSIEHGYFHKSRQNWSNTLQFDGLESKWVELKMKVRLDNFNFDYYPYLDTFKWLDNEGNLYNFLPDTSCKVLSSPNGGKESQNYLEFDEIGRDWHTQGSLIYVEVQDILTSERYVNYSEYCDTYILKTESTWSEKYRDFIHLDDSKNDYVKLTSRLERIEKIESELYKTKLDFLHSPNF